MAKKKTAKKSVKKSVATKKTITSPSSAEDKRESCACEQCMCSCCDKKQSSVGNIGISMVLIILILAVFAQEYLWISIVIVPLLFLFSLKKRC